MSQNPYHNGGGFVQGSPYGGSQDSPGGSKKVAEAVQVHQDADFSIDGYDVSQLMLIGQVRNVQTTPTNVQYSVGDGTAYVDVRKWLDSAEGDGQAQSDAQQDKYVCVLGSLKTFGNKRHINAQSVRTIDDLNEIHYHLLKAQYVSLSLRNPGGARAAGAGAGNGQQADYAAGLIGAGNAAGTDNYAHLNPMQKRIMKLVREDESDEGLHVSSITKNIGGGNSEAVMEAVEALMSEGMLFSTIDDLHVKAVD